MHADLQGPDVARPLAAVVVDLQPAGLFAAHLEPLAAPELRLRRRAGAGRSAQHGRVLGNKRDGQRQERDHLRAPTRPPVSSAPADSGGTTMTWILSESLSASAFWMSSGFCAMSCDSRAICSVWALPVTSRR